MKILSTLSEDKRRRVPAMDRSLIEPIGELTVNFAMLEQTLKDGIGLLLFPEGDDGWAHVTAAIVTSEMSFRKLVDLFQCLVTHRCAETDVATCRALSSEMYRLEQRRNAIIHSHWAIDGTSRATVRMKTTAKGKGLKRHEEVLTRPDISKIANELAELAERLENFIRPEPRQSPTGHSRATTRAPEGGDPGESPDNTAPGDGEKRAAAERPRWASKSMKAGTAKAT